MPRPASWLPPLALVALSFALYANAMPAAFQFDDTTSIVDNPAIAALDPRAWWSFWPGRILAYGSFALDRRVHGLTPTGFHVTNVLVHAAASLAAYWLLVQLAAQATPRVGARWAALAGAAVFAAHPLQTQAVTYVAQRCASLCAALYLATVSVWLYGQLPARRGRARWTLPVALLLGLATNFTKELAITLPLAVLLVDRVAFAGERGTLRRVAPLLPLCAVVPLVAAVGHRFGVAGGGLSGETTLVSRGTYALTQIDVVARYLRLLVLPLGQNVDHDIAWRHAIGEGSPPLLLLVLLHAAVLAAAIAAWRRGARLWAMGPLWFSLTLLPESSVFPIRDAMFEHRLYLPMLGPALLAGLSLERLARWRRPAGVAALAGVILLLGGLTVARNRVWRTPETLWRDAVAKSPGKARPWLGLGAALGRAGATGEASRCLERALALRPDYEEAWTNLGNVRLRAGDLPAAITAYHRAIEVKRDHVAAWYNLGVALDRAADLEGAAQAYSQALRLRTDDAASLNGLAGVRLKQGRAEEALPLARHAAALGGAAPRLLQEIERALASGLPSAQRLQSPQSQQPPQSPPLRKPPSPEPRSP
jgi:Flp pilus assembly protein TadD